ncbi:hypothetical protein KP509_33G046400 [Ceratopteris richardii]|nr:hypothetical protein KP509_33G046400 [Ceratopteris richardii]
MCPICMEIPHNAVLLRCSSYDKGCRPYMCDTSYRHSNCLDQYLKAHVTCQKSRNNDTGPDVSLNLPREDLVSDTVDLRNTVQDLDEQHLRNDIGGDGARGQEPQTSRGYCSQRISRNDLLGSICPLCRGDVKGCEVDKAARAALNRKTRVCAREACSFSGSYKELRAHARKEHPSVRPAEIDPARQRQWARIEQQRELADVLSVIQASVPHATVAGDYAIDGENDFVDNVERSFLYEEGHLLTIFLSLQLFGSVPSFAGGRPFPPYRGVLRRHRRSNSSVQGLWGELLQHNQSTESSSHAAALDPDNEGFWERMYRYQHEHR